MTTRKGWSVKRTLGVALTATALAAGTVSLSPASADESNPLAGMSLKDKVGQLFVISVAGDLVDTDDANAVDINRRLYGFDNAEQIIDAYRPGGIIYFRG